MKTIIILGVVASACAFVSIRKKEEVIEMSLLLKDDPLLTMEYNNFKKTHSKNYTKVEERLRKVLYRLNKNWIEKQNEELERDKESYFRLGINQYSDMFLEEAQEKSHGFLIDDNDVPPSDMPFQEELASGASAITAPELVNWSEIENAPKVTSQGECGSCYAKTALGVLEYYKAIKKEPISLSVQEVIDCSRPEGNLGCNGGQMTKVYEYIKNKGISSAASYPYTQRDGVCQADTRKVIKISGYSKLDSLDEDILLDIVSKGPVCGAMDSSCLSILGYKEGIYNDKNCSSKKVDHAVMIVGYGIQDEIPYWIIQNSWGDKWGEAGFMKLLRGKNQCGILNMLSIPII